MAENYIGFEKSLNLDELLANPATPVRLENVSVSGGEFNRGCILAGASGIFAPVTSAADKEKVLVIAAEDYSDSSTGVVTAYTTGDFHAEKLSTGASVVSAADFKEPLRQVGIYQSKLFGALEG